MGRTIHNAFAVAQTLLASALILVLTLGILTLGLAPSRVSAEVLDCIVATVNGRVILQSDLDDAICYEALLSNRALDQFTADDRHAALDRLIDQELLREQMKSAEFRHATEAEITSRITEARKLYPQAAADDAWQSLLAGYHITEKDLRTRVQQEIDLMRLVNARLRPAVQIDSKSVESYYRDQFVPKLKQSGASDVALADVSAKIRELLTEQKVSEMLVSWLQTLRSESQVRLPGITPPSNDPGVTSQ